MVTEAILLPEWISKLLGKIGKIQADRQQELDELSEMLGGDPEQLTKFYIEPYCQNISPSDREEDEPWAVFRQPIRSWLNGWFRSARRGFREDDGRHVLFVLADAGMGKTALLVMLKMTHLAGFWPKKTNVKILKIGDDTVDRIAEIKDRRSTILLLDALDEDPEAWSDFEGRIKALLTAVRGFRRVLISCRTQFFPERTGRIEYPEREGLYVGGFQCRMVYLSLFDDDQVRSYIEKVFPKREGKQIEAFEMIGKMHSLRMRPMLLAHIGDLMDVDVAKWSSYRVYEALVGRWLSREERKPQTQVSRDDLLESCQLVAYHMQRHGSSRISLDEIEEFLQDRASHISTLDFTGRALMNRVGEKNIFRFAHRSIQEFLVVNLLIERDFSVSQPVSMTDEMVRFFGDWVSEDVRLRIAVSRRLHSFVRESQMPPGWLRAQADLSGDFLSDVVLINVNLSFANLCGSNLENAVLSGADFTGANLRRANLRGADLKGAILRRCDLHKAIISQDQLEGAFGDSKTRLPSGMRAPASWR